MSATTSPASKPIKKGWLTRLRQRNVLPGFGLSMGITVFSLSLLVVLPFAMMAYTHDTNGLDGFLGNHYSAASHCCYQTQFMDVVFGDANQHGVWYAGRLGAGAL